MSSLTVPIPPDLRPGVSGRKHRSWNSPRHALAVGVEPGIHEIAVHFLLTEVDEQDEEDMTEIVDELSILLGDVVGIRRVTEVRARAHTDPLGSIRWTYRARFAEEPGSDET